MIMTNDKERSVVTDTPFCKGDFVCIYDGELLSSTEAERRLVEYEEEKGSFMFFFKHEGKKLWLV